MKAHLVLAVCVVAATAAAAGAAQVRVDWAGGGDYLTIQEGIDGASEGDTVLVASGTYYGPMNRDISLHGKDLYLMSEEGADATTINCEGLGRGFIITGGETSDTVIEGFTVANGVAPLEGETAGFGGGLYCAGAQPIILKCTFRDNSGEFGGAMHCGSSAIMEIVLCDFEDNTSISYGGGIYTYGARVIITKCDFTRNQAVINGGAVCCKTGTLIDITDCDFYDNYAGDGGAIYIGTFDGGGEEPEEPSTVGWCEFNGNSAIRGGALFINGFTWANCKRCYFDYNTATLQGGAIYALTDYTRSLQVTNCTMAFNGAEHGGGVYAAGSYGFQMAVTNSIIAFGTQGAAVQAEDYGTINTTLCLAFENEDGDQLYGSRVLFEDPLFCDVYNRDYWLCENSICRRENNPWGHELGAASRSCDPCAAPVEGASWGAIKAMYK